MFKRGLRDSRQGCCFPILHLDVLVFISVLILSYCEFVKSKKILKIVILKFWAILSHCLEGRLG